MLPIAHLGERAAFFVLRLAASCMTFTGLALIVPSVTFLTLATDASQMTLAGTALRFAAILLIAGAASWYVSGRRQGILPNERVDRAADATPLGGWLLLLALCLIALPAWMFIRLEPLMALWSRSIELLRQSGVWGQVQRAPDYSGLVLIPIIGILGVPFLEAATAVSFIAGSALLLFLLCTESARFPRAFLVCMLLQSGLVLTSRYGTDLMAAVSRIIVQESAKLETAPPEERQVLEEIRRYNNVIRASADTLTLTLFGYLVWTPSLFLSNRVKTTFARTTLPAQKLRGVSIPVRTKTATYRSVEEMPSDIRALYERAKAAAEADPHKPADPSAPRSFSVQFEHRIGTDPVRTKTATYRSVEEMPSDIRALYERAAAAAEADPDKPADPSVPRSISVEFEHRIGTGSANLGGLRGGPDGKHADWAAKIFGAQASGFFAQYPVVGALLLAALLALFFLFVVSWALTQ